MSDTPQNTPGITEVALEWPVKASVQRVWDALFTQPQKWWPHAHRAIGEDAKMTCEALVGAQMREDSASGAGVIWYTVFALDPVRSVDLKGDLAARYGGPASSFLHIEIVPGSSDQTSVLKLTDSVFGRIGPEMKASLTSGWQGIFGDGLVAFIEGAGE